MKTLKSLIWKTVVITLTVITVLIAISFVLGLALGDQINDQCHEIETQGYSKVCD